MSIIGPLCPECGAKHSVPFRECTHKAGCPLGESDALFRQRVTPSVRPTVINIKNAPEGWRDDLQYYYIGRAVWFKGLKKSPLHNPFKIGEHGTREECITLFEKHSRYLVETNPFFKTLIKSLKGKTLVCWCKPEACHGDVLGDLCEELWSVAA